MDDQRLDRRLGERRAGAQVHDQGWEEAQAPDHVPGGLGEGEGARVEAAVVGERPNETRHSIEIWFLIFLNRLFYLKFELTSK